MTAEGLKAMIQDETGKSYDPQKVLQVLNGKIMDDELKYLSNLFAIDKLTQETARLCGTDIFQNGEPIVKTEEPFLFDDDELMDSIGVFLDERFEKVFGLTTSDIFE